MLIRGRRRVLPVAGVWSSAATGLHYDAFENETLTLGPRGHGVLSFERPGYVDLVLFDWRVHSIQRIALVYRGRRESADGTTRAAAADTLPTLIRYDINEQDTPLAGRSTILRIEPPILLAREFGLVRGA